MDAELSSSIISSLRRQALPDYCDRASFMMLIYDHILTLNLEINLIWSAPWSMIKLLYIMVAYLGLSEAIFIFGTYTPYLAASCTRVQKTNSMLVVTLMALGELILIFRTWVIFRRRKWVGIALLVSYVATVVVVFLLMAQSIKQVKSITDPDTGRRRCILIQGESPVTAVVMIMFACVDTVIVTLTLYHGWINFRMIHSSNLVVTLYRDGMMYYVYMLGFSVFNTITMASSFVILAGMQAMLHVVLIKRILLNLRVASSRDLSDHTRSNYRLETMAFAIPPAAATERVSSSLEIGTAI